MSDARIIFGFHAVISRLRQSPASVREIYLDSGRRDPRTRELIRLAESKHVRASMVDRSRLDGIAGDGKHQGVVARVGIAPRSQSLEEVLDQLAEPALLLVLDGIQDPHNLGACLRVADGFGAHAVVAPKDRAVGLTPVVFKVASGAADTVPYFAVTNLARTLRELKERGIRVIGAAADAPRNLYSVELPGPIAWVLGAEGEGMRRLTRETCDELVSVPMSGTVESLNVSVTSGICLFEARRQRASARKSL